MGLTAGAMSLSGCAAALTQSSEAAVESAGNKPDPRPNIVLILADDMGYSDIGCYGGEVNTPNIDGLAKRGLRFSRFYNATRCCPTRASLLTGLYSHQAGMGGMTALKPKPKQGPYQGYLNDRCVTIAEVLRSAAYTTLMSGKWHVGEVRPYWPTDRGFDKYWGLIGGVANYFDVAKTGNEAGGAGHIMAKDDQPFVPAEEGFYMTDAITDNAIEMLDSAGKKDNPFFMYVAYTAPHYPLHALPEDIAKYRGKFMKGWEVLRQQRYERQLAMGLIDKKWGLSPRDPEVPAWDTIDKSKQDEMDLKMAIYAAQIDRMDQGIGRIVSKLKSMGKEENTLILFLSDNGACRENGRPFGSDWRQNGLPPGGVDSFMSYGRCWANLSNAPLRWFKHWAHEGGCCTPLIACWPKKIKNGGQITHQWGHVIDFMATCCDLAQTPYPKTYRGNQILPVEGLSLVPIFLGQTRKGHELVCWEHEGNKAARMGNWKLVSIAKGEWELYDMDEDGTEVHNLVQKYPDKVNMLNAKYVEWYKRVTS